MKSTSKQRATRKSRAKKPYKILVTVRKDNWYGRDCWLGGYRLPSEAGADNIQGKSRDMAVFNVMVEALRRVRKWEPADDNRMPDHIEIVVKDE
jgi:hypothetical protein